MTSNCTRTIPATHAIRRRRLMPSRYPAGGGGSTGRGALAGKPPVAPERRRGRRLSSVVSNCPKAGVPGTLALGTLPPPTRAWEGDLLDLPDRSRRACAHPPANGLAAA